MNGTPWTKDQEIKLKELIESGIKYGQIAKILNKTAGSVNTKARRLNLKYVASDTWTEEEVLQLTNLVKQNVKYKQIAQILNKSKNSIIGKANRLNLKYSFVKKEIKVYKTIKPEAFVPKVLPNAPESLNLTVQELEKNNCRYIPGEDHRFCGHKTMENSSYCEYHKNICCISSLPLI